LSNLKSDYHEKVNHSISILYALCITAQNWTPDEKLILDRVKTGKSSWQDAVNNKDLSIWLKAADLADDFQG
jgi:hypothetical protein